MHKSRRKRSGETFSAIHGKAEIGSIGLNSQVTDVRIQKASEFLHEGAFGRVQLADVAKALRMSTSHLRHLFKRHLGMTPTQYLKCIRLQKSKDLLESTYLSIKEVAFAAGLNDISHFSRDFKQTYGLTASQVRGWGVHRSPRKKRTRNFRQ